MINIVTLLLKELCTKVPWIFLCLKSGITHWVASSTWIVHESAIENRKVNEVHFPTFLYLHWPIRIIKYQGKSVFLFSHSQNWKSIMHFGNGIPSNIRKITISQNKKWPHKKFIELLWLPISPVTLKRNQFIFLNSKGVFLYYDNYCILASNNRV